MKIDLTGSNKIIITILTTTVILITVIYMIQSNPKIDSILANKSKRETIEKIIIKGFVQEAESENFDNQEIMSINGGEYKIMLEKLIESRVFFIFVTFESSKVKSVKVLSGFDNFIWIENPDEKFTKYLNPFDRPRSIFGNFMTFEANRD